MFKDYLIFDDVSEFLKRFYECTESKKRLPKVIEFYETYSKVFPNYVNLPENKFMFKNIERKQLYWDSKQQFLMEQEERNNRKRARIEDFGGVQNAPSSFFNESIDDRLFSESFMKSVNSMDILPDNHSNIANIITLKNEYDSRVMDLSQNIKEPPPSATKQFEKLIKSFANKETSSIHSKSFISFSELSKQLEDESYFDGRNNIEINKETDISNYFKESSLKMRQQEKQRMQKVSKLRQYNEHSGVPEKHDIGNASKKQRNEGNAIEIISNHYTGKARTNRLPNNQIDGSTKPSTDNKIVINSNIQYKRSTDAINLKTTDSSELVKSNTRRDSSERKKK